EYLSYPHVGAFFRNEEDATKYRRRKLTRSIVFLPYSCVVDAFQHEVYERPDMTPDERAAAWSRHWARFMVGEDWSGHEADLARLWQR
ncbi:M3 family oligoendopeptidase, partial [Staphylococcus aureus]